MESNKWLIFIGSEWVFYNLEKVVLKLSFNGNKILVGRGEGRKFLVEGISKGFGK